jgi:hypothetical protein
MRKSPSSSVASTHMKTPTTYKQQQSCQPCKDLHHVWYQTSIKFAQRTKSHCQVAQIHTKKMISAYHKRVAFTYT